MSWLDWALLAVLLLSAVVGLWRGLVYEVLSVAVWVVAFVLAQRYGAPVGIWLPVDGFSEPLRVAMGFAAVFLASPMASYITGVVLAVDGGQCLGGSAHFNAGARAFLDEQIRSSERPTPTTTAAFRSRNC